MGRYYKLEGHEPVPCTIEEFGKIFRANGTEEERRIAATRVKKPEVCFVSTVFLGIDHNYSKEGPPLLFETMVFEGRFDEYQERYSTWEEAEAGHERIVEMVSGSAPVECSWCHGDGCGEDQHGNQRTCPRCKGKGQVHS